MSYKSSKSIFIENRILFNVFFRFYISRKNHKWLFGLGYSYLYKFNMSTSLMKFKNEKKNHKN